jgi:hypothetical protein
MNCSIGITFKCVWHKGKIIQRSGRRDVGTSVSYNSVYGHRTTSFRILLYGSEVLVKFQSSKHDIDFLALHFKTLINNTEGLKRRRKYYRSDKIHIYNAQFIRKDLDDHPYILCFFKNKVFVSLTKVLSLRGYFFYISTLKTVG